MNRLVLFGLRARRRAALPLCLALAIVLAACGPTPPPTASPTPAVNDQTPAPIGSAAASQPPISTPSPGATTSPTPAPEMFTIALAEAPGSLDPALAADRAGLLITRHIYEGLLAYEAGGTRPVAALAETWEASPDGLTWTFHLRPSVQFSDGTPFDAEAARLNFERWQNADPPGPYTFWRAIFGGFAGEKGPDDEPLSLLASASAPAAQTLVLVLTRPYAGLPNILAMPSFAMVSPAAFANAASASGLEAASAGTGPYLLAGASPEQIIPLRRNPGYWGGNAGGPDTLIFKAIADDQQRLLAVVSNEAEVMSSVNPRDYAAAGAAGAATSLVFDPALDVVYLGFNHARSPWDNLECRMAVAYALDKTRYVSEFFPGDGQVAESMLPPAVWGYTAAFERSHDLALARQHWESCQAAGVTLPVTTTLYVPPIPRPYLPDPAALGAAIQADLAALSLTVTITSPDWQTTWLPDVHSGRADLFLLGWTGISGEPDSFLCPLFCGAEGAFNNDKGQPLPPDEELARLLQDARQTVNPAARESLYAQAQARIADAVPAVPLAYRQTSWAFQTGIEGYTPSPIDSVFFHLRNATP